MKFVTLGNTELKVTDFCLGTLTWVEQTDEVDAHKQIEMSLDAGINFIDTAEMYPVCPLRAETTGDTERILGNWLGKNSQKRKELVIATKISGKGYKNVRNGKGIFPKEIRLAIEGSLKNLQTDYIDLYQLHWPNRGSYHFRQYWNYDPTSQKSSVDRENIELVIKELYDLKKERKIIIRPRGAPWGKLDLGPKGPIRLRPGPKGATLVRARKKQLGPGSNGPIGPRAPRSQALRTNGPWAPGTIFDKRGERDPVLHRNGHEPEPI